MSDGLSAGEDLVVAHYGRLVFCVQDRQSSDLQETEGVNKNTIREVCSTHFDDTLTVLNQSFPVVIIRIYFPLKALKD